MVRPHEGDVEVGGVDRAAGVRPLAALDAVAAQDFADLVHRNERRIVGFADQLGIADMVLVAMGQHDMGGAAPRRLRFDRGHRIVGDEGIDEDDRLTGRHAKSRMSEPGEFHEGSASQDMIVDPPI